MGVTRIAALRASIMKFSPPNSSATPESSSPDGRATEPDPLLHDRFLERRDTSVAAGTAVSDGNSGLSSSGVVERRFVRGRRSVDQPAAVRSVLLLDDKDQLEPFAPAVLAVRWATTVACLALSWTAFAAQDWSIIPWTGAILANTAIRTVTPLRYDGSTRSTLNLLIEVAFNFLAVSATNSWESPLVLALVNAVIVAAFARGFGFGIRIGAASAISVSVASLLQNSWTDADVVVAGRWTTVLILGGIVAGYARRISWEAAQQHSLALSRLTRLADANTLLSTLHRVAQTLPASLDSDEVLDSAVTRLRGLLDFESVAIMTTDETDRSLTVVKRAGAKTASRFAFSDLPPIAQRAIRTHSAVIADGDADGEIGLLSTSTSAMYAPMLARGTLIGLIALERSGAEEFSTRDLEVVRAFVEPTALAIDNARWFSRIRTVGADEERTRIARDLHDRIGQALAYLAFELDRVVRRNEMGEPVDAALEELRGALRDVVGEVRDTLYDLRSDVDDNKDFGAMMEEFSDRVSVRSDLDITLTSTRDRRLPIRQEREMWRIAQEALINVERHADAKRVNISWHCNGASAELLVSDDGVGFAGDAGRADSYGLMGMRERAASIGATLEFHSAIGEGTTVRCSLKER